VKYKNTNNDFVNHGHPTPIRHRAPDPPFLYIAVFVGAQGVKPLYEIDDPPKKSKNFLVWPIAFGEYVPCLVTVTVYFFIQERDDLWGSDH